MIRRKFIKLATLTSATGLASLGTVSALESHEARDARAAKTVTWHVSGFTCVTCAVGLEVMLRRHKGVKSAEASYPGATVTIGFDPEQVSEASLRSLITEIGFTADEQKG